MTITTKPIRKLWLAEMPAQNAPKMDPFSSCGNLKIIGTPFTLLQVRNGQMLSAISCYLNYVLRSLCRCQWRQFVDWLGQSLQEKHLHRKRRSQLRGGLQLGWWRFLPAPIQDWWFGSSSEDHFNMSKILGNCLLMQMKERLVSLTTKHLTLLETKMETSNTVSSANLYLES